MGMRRDGKRIIWCGKCFCSASFWSRCEFISDHVDHYTEDPEPAVQRLGYKTINDLPEQEYEALKAEMAQHKCLGPSLNSGGHLTHGTVRMNIMSKLMHCLPYEVNLDTELFDYDEMAKIAKEHKPPF